MNGPKVNRLPVGIAVLVVEIRQNTVATEVMAAQNVMSSINDQVNLMLANDSVTGLIARVSEDAELASEDQLRLGLLASNQLRAWQSVYFQYERGALDEALWHTTISELAIAFVGTPIQSAWEQRRDAYLPGFNAELEALIEQATED